MSNSIRQNVVQILTRELQRRQLSSRVGDTNMMMTMRNEKKTLSSFMQTAAEPASTTNKINMR